MRTSMGANIAPVTTSDTSGSNASASASASDSASDSASEDFDFVENACLKELLRIPDATMNQAMDIAYKLYVSRRLVEAEIVCRGLIACDHRHWWPHSLRASVLRRLARVQEALRALEEGLKYAPRNPKLLLMHAELLTALDRKRPSPPPSATEQSADAHGSAVTTPASIANGAAPPRNGALT